MVGRPWPIEPKQASPANWLSLPRVASFAGPRWNLSPLPRNTRCGAGGSSAARPAPGRRPLPGPDTRPSTCCILRSSGQRLAVARQRALSMFVAARALLVDGREMQPDEPRSAPVESSLGHGSGQPLAVSWVYEPRQARSCATLAWAGVALGRGAVVPLELEEWTGNKYPRSVHGSRREQWMSSDVVGQHWGALSLGRAQIATALKQRRKSPRPIQLRVRHLAWQAEAPQTPQSFSMGEMRILRSKTLRVACLIVEKPPSSPLSPCPGGPLFLTAFAYIDA